MFSATLTIKNKTGLHARPASGLSLLCRKFESKIRIITESTEADPTSVISLMAAGIKQGSNVNLTVEGPDEEAAGREIVSYIEGLGE